MYISKQTVIALTLLLLPILSIAQDDLSDIIHQVYKARISEKDHFSSSGQRLNTAAAIVRQDRANFHVFNIKDAEDESDEIFKDKEARSYMEKMLSMSNITEKAILNGTPVIKVKIVGDSADVILVDDTNKSKLNDNIVMGRCRMDSCWWWKVEHTQEIQSDAKGKLVKTFVRTTSIDFPTSVVEKKGYPDFPPKKAKWEDRTETFIFCSNKTPAYFEYDKKQRKFVGSTLTGNYDGFTEGEQNLYTYICRSKINPNENYSEISIDKPTDIFNF